MLRFGLQPALTAANDWITIGCDETVSPDDWVFLGRLSEFGRQWPVRFAVGDEKVIAIFGKRGQGKSYTLGTLLESLALRDKTSGLGSIARDRAVLLIDPLNIFQWIDIPLTPETREYSDELRRQADRAAAWGLVGTGIDATVYYPAGFEASAFRPGSQEFRLGVTDFSLDEWAVLLDFDVVKDIRGQLISEVHQKVTADGWIGDGGTVAASPQPTIDHYIECLKDDLDFKSGIYSGETLRAVSQRLRAIRSYDIFQGAGTPLTELLKPGKISVLLMNALPENLRHVVVSVIARRITIERAAASAAAKDLLLSTTLSPQERDRREEVVRAAPPRTWLVIDEAQDLIPAGKKTSATESIVKLVKEGRNFGLSFVLTTQQPRAVDSRVLSQVETFFVHKLVSRSDIDLVIENLKCPLPTEVRVGDGIISVHELVAMLGVGQMMVSDTHSNRCVVVAVRPRIGAHGGFEA